MVQKKGNTHLSTVVVVISIFDISNLIGGGSKPF